MIKIENKFKKEKNEKIFYLVCIYKHRFLKEKCRGKKHLISVEVNQKIFVTENYIKLRRFNKKVKNDWKTINAIHSIAL